jgi:hypothetical protein
MKIKTQQEITNEFNAFVEEMGVDHQNLRCPTVEDYEYWAQGPDCGPDIQDYADIRGSVI